MKTVAYLRVSTRSQDLANQKLAILEFSQKRRFPIDQFIESRISSRQSPLERRIDEMLGMLEPGDRLLVSELSRLGRSLSQVIQIVDRLVHRKIRFIAIKEAIEFDGKQDLRTKVMIALFGLFAEVERDLISERTKEGLAAAKAKGKRLGREHIGDGYVRVNGGVPDLFQQTRHSSWSPPCVGDIPKQWRTWTCPTPISRGSRILATAHGLMNSDTAEPASYLASRHAFRARSPDTRLIAQYGASVCREMAEPVAVV